MLKFDLKDGGDNIPAYIQNNDDKIRDFIFPIVTAKKENDTLQAIDFYGTGFLIGKRGYALTASHVVNAYNGMIGALFVNVENKWTFLEIDQLETHPSEDVAVMHLVNPDYDWKSPFLIDERQHYGWCEFLLGGYPSDVTWEIAYERFDPKMRPDLVHIKGNVRRRYSREINNEQTRGSHFYELSGIAGQGCSGSPIFIIENHIWHVIGIYVVEMASTYSVGNGESISLNVSYAVRSDSFSKWKPKLLSGLSIREESIDYII